MQIATITILIESEKEQFDAKADDINKKAQEKLKKGEYTCDITDVVLAKPVEE